MANRHAEVAPGQAARIAGSGYLAIFVLAIFANFFVRERLIDPGDAAAAGDLGTVRQLNPWHWYLDRNLLAEGATPAALLVPLAISAVLAGVAWAVFGRRDLR